MNPQELAKNVAEGSNPTITEEVLQISSADMKSFFVAGMQRASQFSTDAKEAQEVPLNSETAYKVRQNMVRFVSSVMQAGVTLPATDAYNQHLKNCVTAIWGTRYAEIARRRAEDLQYNQPGQPPVRLSFGLANFEELLPTETKQAWTGENAWGDVFENVTSRVPHPFINPLIAKEGLRQVAKRALFNATAANPDFDTRQLIGYEQAYWLGLEGKFAEAKASFLVHAKACADNRDTFGEAIFKLQAVKAGIDGKLSGAAEELVATHESVLGVLQDNREKGLAKQWLGQTMGGHQDQAIQIESSLAERVAKLKVNTAAALNGTLETPSIGM